MKRSCIIGIDPGKGGGISVITELTPIPTVVKMPKTVTELKNLFLLYVELKPIVYIEKVSMWHSDKDNKGKDFMIQKMLANYTELLTVLEFMGIEYVEVFSRTWIKAIGLGSLKVYKERKARNKSHAQYLFPTIKVTLWNSDALLLLQYGIMKEIGAIRQPVKKKNIQKKLF